MASTTTVAGGNGSGSARVDRPRFEPPTQRRRHVRRALALVLVAAACAALFAALFIQAGNRRPVLAVARTVAAGSAIADEDLTVVRVSAESRLRLVPASARERIVGRAPTATLVAGTLVSETQLAERLAPGPGQSVVAVQLKGSRVVPLSLRPGERVQVVLTAGSEADRGDARLGTVMGEGRVLAVDQPKNAAETRIVSVLVDGGIAPSVAGAAAADRVSLGVLRSPA